MKDGRKRIYLSTFVDRDVLVARGGDNLSSDFRGSEVDHSSSVGDVRRSQVGTLGEGEVNEVDDGGVKENMGGLGVRVTPSQGVELSQPVSDIDGGVENAVAPGQMSDHLAVPVRTAGGG